MMPDSRPLRTASAPSVGSVPNSLMMRISAGRLPDEMTVASWRASSRVKSPVICALPPVMAFWMVGAL